MEDVYGLLESPEETLRRYTEDVEAFEIIEPKPNQLFLDIDNEDDIDHADRMNALLTRNGFGSTTSEVRESQTPGHYHVVVTLDRDVDPLTRIALQACLGSDRKREAYSLLRILLDTGHTPTVFFERKEVAVGENS